MGTGAAGPGTNRQCSVGCVVLAAATHRSALRPRTRQRAARLSGADPGRQAANQAEKRPIPSRPLVAVQPRLLHGRRRDSQIQVMPSAAVRPSPRPNGNLFSSHGKHETDPSFHQPAPTDRKSQRLIEVSACGSTKKTPAPVGAGAEACGRRQLPQSVDAQRRIPSEQLADYPRAAVVRN